MSLNWVLGVTATAGQVITVATTGSPMAQSYLASNLIRLATVESCETASPDTDLPETCRAIRRRSRPGRMRRSVDVSEEPR
jgi:hypothetical protein